MKTITAIEAQRGKKDRVNIFLEGRYAFSLDAFLAATENLSVGQSLDDERLGELVQKDGFQRCYDAAVRFLSYRPRSAAEVRQRLRKNGFHPDVADAVLGRLREQRFVDDDAFAKFWVENRKTFSPRGERLLKLELRQKGVDSETITSLVDDADDAEAAFAVAAKKAKSLGSCDCQEFRQRMGAFLQRRGFAYDTASQVVDRLWQERRDLAHG